MVNGTVAQSTQIPLYIYIYDSMYHITYKITADCVKKFNENSHDWVFEKFFFA